MRIVLDTRPQRGKATILITNCPDFPTIEDLCNMRDLFNDAMMQIATLTINNLSDGETTEK